jgi:hypothetical protein
VNPPLNDTLPTHHAAALADVVEPLLVQWNSLPHILAVSRASLARMRVRGAFGPEVLRAGRRLLVRVDELRRWVDAGMPNRATWIAMQGPGRRRVV